MTDIQRDELEQTLAEKFKQLMLFELRQNHDKGCIFEIDDFNYAITELEYHKAKLFLAIRVKNIGAMREYLADAANYLLLIGHMFNVYDTENSTSECYEVNKDVDIFKKIDISEHSINQTLV